MTPPPKGPIRIELPGGETVVVWRDGDRIALVIDLAGERGGAMVMLPLPAAAYIAGGLASHSGVHDA